MIALHTPFAKSMGFALSWRLVIIGSAWPVWGWKECLISPEDEWKEATERIPAIRMREEYERTYTCRTNDTEGVLCVFLWQESLGKKTQVGDCIHHQ